MLKKIIFLSLMSLVLGGCTILPKLNPAATDSATPSPSSSPRSSDQTEVSAYEQSQITSGGTDEGSLEKDLNSTTIPDDDLTDIFSN